jgi:RNA polymerase sigma-70 factor (ECF subfamily)
VNEPVWLEPYPDDLLAADSASPESTVMRREHITLAFIVALQSLPPRQRAVLILRDVLDWRASEVADLLQTTAAAVKSALHRARSTLADREPYPDLSEPEPDLLEAYVRAWETANIPALLRLLTEDATFSMPPIPAWYRGRDEIAALTGRTIFSGDAAGRWRLLPTRANGQPAFGLYRASGDGTYSGYGIQAVTLRRDGIADIITFRKPGLIAAFGLPAALTD